MNLRECLLKEGFTITAAAAKLKITRKHLSAIANGDNHASFHLAKAIERLTKGNVRAETLMNPRKEHGAT